MRGRQLRRGFAVAIVAVALCAPAAGQSPPPLPTPEQYFGFPMGADRQLAHWDDMVDYFRVLAAGSDRMLVEELGTTTLGHPYLLVTVSSPDTLRELPRHQALQRRLADPRGTSAEEASSIARSGKAVVLIGANVHSTEIGTSQVMVDIIHQLATEQSAWVRHLLANTIILLIPSQNPDGQRMVVDWYRRNVGTAYEAAPLPELYHPFAGHDNNRDSYMLTQVETQHLSRVLYQQWLPEVYLDMHQMGNRAARIFVPPFRNPANPNVDPLVWSQVNLLGQGMAAKLHEADKTGVIWGELYSGYWQGANNTTPWWHNMVALLTEIASADVATPVRQRVASPTGRDETPRGGWIVDGRPVLAAPTDTQFRMNYPRPWRGGPWTLGDVVEYGRLATLGLLETVANHRITLKRNFHRMNRGAIERFANGDPFAFVIPSRQHDPAALAKLLSLLQAGAAEVHRARAPFTADDTAYPAGTFVVRLDQPFGRWVKDILEPQVYPRVRWPGQRAPAETPYDVTAWSLGMLMGVETVLVERPFDARLTMVGEARAETASNDTSVQGPLSARGRDTFLLASTSNTATVALNRLLTADVDVSWLQAAAIVDGRSHPPGTIVVHDVDHTLARRLARELSLPLVAAELPDGLALLPIRAPRLAVYEPWGGNMDAGWTRWVLEQHDFDYTRVRPADMRRSDLSTRFDVIVLPQMTTLELVRGLQTRSARPEHRGGIGPRGVRNLRQFADRGGTIITLGNTATFAAEQLTATLTNVVRDQTRDSFAAPGSILSAHVDATHPIGYGMPDTIDVMFVDNGAYVPNGRRSSDRVPRVIVRYPDAPLLRSGWMVGESKIRGAGAVLEIPVGDGRLILHTFRVQHRGQTWGTFKLLFNSIFYGASARDHVPVRSTLDAADG